MKLRSQKVGLPGKAGGTTIQGLGGKISKAEITCVSRGYIPLVFYHLANKIECITASLP